MTATLSVVAALAPVSFVHVHLATEQCFSSHKHPAMPLARAALRPLWPYVVMLVHMSESPRLPGFEQEQEPGVVGGDAVWAARRQLAPVLRLIGRRVDHQRRGRRAEKAEFVRHRPQQGVRNVA